MNGDGDFSRSPLAQALRALIGTRVGGERAARIGTVAAALAEGLTAAEAERTEAEPWLALSADLLDFIGHRPAERAKIRMFNPDPERQGWASPHSVIEILNDDMPFLVDSVAMALAAAGLRIHLLLHPILAIDRDGDGALLTLGAGRAESLMHIQVDRQDGAAHGALVARIAAALADVRSAVADWQPLRERLDGLAAALAGGGGGEEAAENVAFLRWLRDGHFTFLGYRHFLLSGPAAAPVVGMAEAEGLGLLRDPAAMVFDDAVALSAMPDEVRAFLAGPQPLLVTKSVRHSLVHRAVAMDVVGIKSRDGTGRIDGLHAFVGLFSAGAYGGSVSAIPLLRRKVARVQARAGLPGHGHDAKALAHILETLPRDELFQMSEDLLLAVSLGILSIETRPRVALFMRRDDFGRFVSCLVYLPRDRYDTPLRHTVTRLLEQAHGGSLDGYAIQVGEAPLARLHLILRTRPDAAAPVIDPAGLEERIAAAVRSWPDRLQDALVRDRGEERGLLLARRWRDAFPAAYRERHGALAALGDVQRLERVAAGEDFCLSLTRPPEAAPGEARLRLLRQGSVVALSDLLPVLEAFGLRVMAEVPHEIRAADLPRPFWLHDFQVAVAEGAALDLSGRAGAFEDALAAVWRGQAESDGFNRLVLGAGLSWREVTVLRAYAKYLRQTGFALSQGSIERAFHDNPAQAAALLSWFRALFDPDHRSGDACFAEAQARDQLDRVDSADDDRILRRFFALIGATLRTNWFLGRDYLSFKLDCAAVPDLPLPRPKVEIFVCSPRVEAVHLRGGRIARGGIRWSDRRDDFRTEILGLMKAQMVKNAVIVPVGAKGGFVVKAPPRTGGRAALQAEAEACYRTMIRGLLDLTDTLRTGEVLPPAAVVRRDGDDPYLVVAADKGTAGFSDIANAIAAEYGFWLGDAFASGGSRGYDHKTMGITARGAWEAVKRHFREMGVDCQTREITVVGVGDPSGDVFGNAMLCSPCLRLVAAFNHSHIFIDPDPDAAASFAERARLFATAKGWDEYDPALISAGGGVFPRAAKTVAISAAMARRFGIAAASLPPAELIRAVLAAPVDLLFFGGIGTYVRAGDESDAAAGDRANDALRLPAGRIAATVVGEGANLAITQRGRIQLALQGVRLNTDAIDNSAGVDTSDHEVNIKIVLNALVAAGEMTLGQRDRLLAEMTDEVAALVLRDNILQTQALSVMEAGGADLLDGQGRFLRLLEKAGRLDRALECLPDDETLAGRAAERRGLTRPELAVSLAYAKIWLHDRILASDLPGEPFLAGDLARYFPRPLRERFPRQIAAHRLGREIVATAITNSMVNRVGIAFVPDLMERCDVPAARVARAYVIARDAHGVRALWQAVETLDGRVAASTQIAMLTEINRLLEEATAWVLARLPAALEVGAAIAALAPGLAALAAALPALLPAAQAETMAGRDRALQEHGVPADTAARMAAAPAMAAAAEIVTLAGRHGATVEACGRLYFALDERFQLGWLRQRAGALGQGSHWHKLAALALAEDVRTLQAALTAQAVPLAADPDAALAAWCAARTAEIGRTDAVLAELRAQPQLDIAMLTVACRRLKTLAEAEAEPT